MDNKQRTRVLDEKNLDEIKHFYDSVYYADRDNKLNLPKHYYRLIKKLGLQSGQKILDVACGSGEWLKVCDEAGLAVNGVDLSDRAIDICKVNMPQGEFYAQSAEQLPFGDNQFDVVTCLGSLEHFVDPVGSIREMIRVSKENAIFIILVPNEDFLTRRLGLFGGTYQVDAKEDVRTLNEWKQLFSEAGLSVKSRWKDLHVVSWSWIRKGKPLMWPIRAVQALMLTVWPLKWQYQVYHLCVKK